MCSSINVKRGEEKPVFVTVLKFARLSVDVVSPRVQRMGYHPAQLPKNGSEGAVCGHSDQLPSVIQVELVVLEADQVAE